MLFFRLPLSNALTVKKFFAKLNSFHRNYMGKEAFIEFVGLQLCYTGNRKWLVWRILFMDLYLRFCRARNSFPSDMTQIGMHLAFAGVQSVTLHYDRALMTFYSGFSVFGMDRDVPYCTKGYTHVYVSVLPYIEIHVKKEEEESQRRGVKRVAGVACKKGPITQYNKYKETTGRAPPPKKRRT